MTGNLNYINKYQMLKISFLRSIQSIFANKLKVSTHLTYFSMTSVLENHTFLQSSLSGDEEIFGVSSIRQLDLKDLLGCLDVMNFLGNIVGIYSKI